jgi:TAT (twin-arginine translocation) pathway signal sequence
MSKFIYRPSGPVISRRQLLKGTAAIAGAAVASSVLPASLRKAAAKTLAYPTLSSFDDIQHMVDIDAGTSEFRPLLRHVPGSQGLQRPDGHQACRCPDATATRFGRAGAGLISGARVAWLSPPSRRDWHRAKAAIGPKRGNLTAR